ncbi:MAG: hypothetical protein KGI89_17520, partial [Euryarchaeota archaeon]|nr:hypothetical protein [Euryarchaeota archaeon]
EVQGPRASVHRLLSAVRGKQGLGDAREVRRIEELPVDPALKGFQIHVDPDPQKASQERMDEAALYLGGTFDLGQANLALGNETLAVGKETLAAVREGNASLAGKIDRGNAMLGRTIEGGNVMLGRKIDGVAVALRQESRSNSEFRHELAGAVGLLDTKYGAISKTLQRMEKDLQAQTKALLHVARAMERTNQFLMKGSASRASRSLRRPRRR